jgi:hypothetical protein
LPNIFQNSFSYIRKTAPPKEPKVEPFSEEPKPYQTGPYILKAPMVLGCLEYWSWASLLDVTICRSRTIDQDLHRNLLLFVHRLQSNEGPIDYN